MYDDHDRSADTEPGIVRNPLLLADARRRRAPVPSREARRGRVLIIDDDARISLSLELILSEWHEVTALTSPSEALRRIRQGEHYDVVLCDVMMPELSAMDLYGVLERELPAWTSRLIFLTGGAFTPRALEFLARVPNARFEKPIDIDGLIAFVRRRVALRLVAE